MTTDYSAPSPTGNTGLTDTGLLVLRLGVGGAALQAGLIKAFDFSATSQFMTEAGWRLPKFAAFMVTAAETLGGIGLLLGALTPLAACAVLSAMLCAWAVNVSAAAFWSEPFNVPFLIGIGAA
ncbi:MAG TPA: DoxX family protein, partial [Mycobacterium sp.]